MNTKVTSIHIALALVVVLIWGVNFVVVKIGLEVLPPIMFTALRFLFAALPLVFFVKRPVIPLKLIAGYGLFQFAMQFTLLFSGMKLGFPPGLASLVLQLHAFFTIGLAVLLLGERPRMVQLVGALIAFSGMALVGMHMEAKATLIGFFMVVCAGACWAIANIITKKIGKTDPLGLVVWASLLATPPLIINSLIVEGVAAWSAAFDSMNWTTAGAIFFQSYPNTIFAYAAWALLMRKYAAATIAPFTLLVPVIGMLSAALILSEELQWWKISAGGLVLCGLVVNLFGARFLTTITLEAPLEQENESEDGKP
jgi:O-acetylserine/cysteine efflux transporter